MKWCLYILKSSKCDKIYIGSTCDIERRLSDHNRGNTPSTKRFIPWSVVYTEEYLTKEEARGRERQIKNWKNRERVEQLIARNKGA
jgi:putative endonuclease